MVVITLHGDQKFALIDKINTTVLRACYVSWQFTLSLEKSQ